MFSACIITYNEQELLPYCLKWLNSLNHLQEICIIDSYSSDNTWNIILEFSKKTNKVFKFKQQEMKSFGKQKNDCITMAEGKWILLIDADETYSNGIDHLFNMMKKGYLARYNAFRIMTLITWPDTKHFVNPEWLDPHIRLWRKDFASYQGDCHEILYDKNGRELHGCYDKDIYTIDLVNQDFKVAMLHHQRLKSDKALLEKGQRWASLDMLKKSAEQNLPVTETSWFEYKQELINGKKTIHEIPPEFWDYK